MKPSREDQLLKRLARTTGCDRWRALGALGDARMSARAGRVALLHQVWRAPGASPDVEVLEGQLRRSGRSGKFSRRFLQPDDYVADGLHRFINEAVAATRQKKRFYMIETGDQTAALAFVTPRTFACARKLGLL